MPRRLREHPDYPFAESNLEATVVEIEQFFARPPLNAAERGEVLEFIRLSRQYAFLERLVQGEILFDLPVHFDVVVQHETGASDESLVEKLAGDERDLLELGIEPAERLLDALDERGIKVFTRSRGPEPQEILTGGFQYAGETGPALLVGAGEASREAVFILAHEYGHLVMDVSPYTSRFCRWRREGLKNLDDSAEERRADRFARALLLPASLFDSTSPDLGLVTGDAAPDESALLRAAEVFDVPPAVVWQRLADLGHPRSGVLPRFAPESCAREVDERRPTDLPERFVNLALAAFGRRIFEKGDLARFLRMPSDGVDRFLSWCPIPRVPKPVDAGEEVEEDEGGGSGAYEAEEERKESEPDGGAL